MTDAAFVHGAAVDCDGARNPHWTPFAAIADASDAKAPSAVVGGRIHCEHRVDVAEVRTPPGSTTWTGAVSETRDGHRSCPCKVGALRSRHRE